MSSTATRSLHRFVPRRALETTSFGYEVAARHRTVEDCVASVQWIDCWCPDAAQFILFEASADLRSGTSEALVAAIGESHLRSKIRLVCSESILSDEALVSTLHREQIGFLLQADGPCDLESLARRGILGVQVADEPGSRTPALADRLDVESLIDSAHNLGLRSIASRVSRPEDVRRLIAAGFDYVSRSDERFVPAEPSFAWQGKVA